jgi:pimeloyl-ACP methyl ester carboxylesterase
MREGHIAVDGGRVWHKIVGENKQAPPLLMLHGGPGAASDYLQPLDALADERPVVFYDQLGGGNSDRPDDEASPAATAHYHTLLPGSEMAVFEDASHSHCNEKADEYVKTVRDFLRRAENT